MLKISNMFLYISVEVTSFSLSSDSRKIGSEFLHNPLQTAQAETHFSPFLLQEHAALHPFLHLHLITFNNCGGAGSLSIMMGRYFPPSNPSIQE